MRTRFSLSPEKDDKAKNCDVQCGPHADTCQECLGFGTSAGVFAGRLKLHANGRLTFTDLVPVLTRRAALRSSRTTPTTGPTSAPSSRRMILLRAGSAFGLRFTLGW